MAKLRSKKGKGGYARYRSANRLGKNQEARNSKRLARIAKRKEWRIRKYGQTPQDQLSITTINLFRQWNIPLIGQRKEKKKHEDHRSTGHSRQWKDNKSRNTMQSVPKHSEGQQRPA